MKKLTGRISSSAGEPLPDVLVSNGREVRRTRTDGSFELDAGGGGFVFVTRPSGFTSSAWFHRVTDRATTYDFVLERAEQPVPFTFAQVTDLHLCVDDEPTGTEIRRPLTSKADLADLLAEIADTPTPDGRGVAFVAATGDLTDRGVPAEYAALRGVLGAAPLPVEVLPGNHDHYGHRHEPCPGDDPLDSHGMSTGTTTRYEEHVGPRWWSMDHGGVHFAAIDWFSHRLGGDRAMQEAWLHADLSAQPEGTLAVLLVHDQMKRDSLERMKAAAPHVRLLGSFSGHWHTCRTVVDNGAIHANTGNATFGSCDFTPPQYRLCTWDGANLAVRTVTRGGMTTEPPDAGTRSFVYPLVRPWDEVWSKALPRGAHMAAPVVANLPDGDDREIVFAVWGNEDEPGGGLLALDAVSGEELWRVGTSSTVRAGAVHSPGVGGANGTVVFASVSGEVFAVDAVSGECLWRSQVGDPLHMWVYMEPLVHGGLVFAGDVVSFQALDVSTGATIWRREDLGRPENYISVAHPVVQAETLLLGFMDQSPNTWGLDPRTGATRWSGGDEPLLSPMSGFLRDPDGEHVYTVRFGGVVEKFSARTGERRWKAGIDTVFTAGRPALAADATGVFVPSSVGTVYRLDAATGETVFSTELADESLLAMGPYRKRGPVISSGSTLTARGVLQGTCGGLIHRVNPVTGEAIVVANLDAPIAAPLAPVGEDVIAVSVDGVVRRLRVSA